MRRIERANVESGKRRLWSAPLRQVTSVIHGEHDREHAGVDAGVGGIVRGEPPRALVVIDLEHHPLVVGIIVGLERVEGGHGVKDDLLALAARRDDAGGERERTDLTGILDRAE